MKLDDLIEQLQAIRESSGNDIVRISVGGISSDSEEFDIEEVTRCSSSGVLLRFALPNSFNIDNETIENIKEDIQSAQSYIEDALYGIKYRLNNKETK